MFKCLLLLLRRLLMIEIFVIILLWKYDWYETRKILVLLFSIANHSLIRRALRATSVLDSLNKNVPLSTACCLLIIVYRFIDILWYVADPWGPQPTKLLRSPFRRRIVVDGSNGGKAFWELILSLFVVLVVLLLVSSCSVFFDVVVFHLLEPIRVDFGSPRWPSDPQKPWF